MTTTWNSQLPKCLQILKRSLIYKALSPRVVRLQSSQLFPFSDGIRLSQVEYYKFSVAGMLPHIHHRSRICDNSNSAEKPNRWHHFDAIKFTSVCVWVSESVPCMYVCRLNASLIYEHPILSAKTPALLRGCQLCKLHVGRLSLR